MDRRKFLAIFPDPLQSTRSSSLHNNGSKGRSSQDGSLSLALGIEEYAGPWTEWEAAHLLRRTMFSVKKEEIDAAVSQGMAQTVAALLSPTATPPEPIAVDNRVEVEWVSKAYQSSKNNLYQTYLLSWWIDLMLQQGMSLTEKMTLFWHNHFATGAISVNDARYMYRQNALLRQYAFGNFKDLVRAITLDPAMLRYLNGSTNRKGAPNENYARELQELFTIGKGPEIAPGNYTNYTEEDIKQAARVLTGWADDTATVGAKFTASNHDTGNKTFTSAYGNRVITGGSGETNARRELDELLTMIFDQGATALYICRKFYRWFVDYVIDDEIENDVIVPLAQIFRNGNYEIAPVIATLLKSAHFYQGGRTGNVIKNPADLVVGTIRAFAWLDDDTHQTFYPDEVAPRNWAYRTLRRQMGTMGMDLMNPPNVAGWPAYWQGPVFHELWINADTLQKRINFLVDVAADGFRQDEAYNDSLIDVIEFVSKLSDPSDVNALIDESVEILLAVTLPADQKTVLRNILLQGLPDYEWTPEWEAYVNDPDNPANANVVAKLRDLFRYILTMAEYQLS